jgi:hypothetical protein
MTSSAPRLDSIWLKRMKSGPMDRVESALLEPEVAWSATPIVAAAGR